MSNLQHTFHEVMHEQHGTVAMFAMRSPVALRYDPLGLPNDFMIMSRTNFD